MNDHFEPTRLTRNNRFIHALMLESQAWSSVTVLGRLMGCYLDERLTRKLGADQQRFLWLTYHCKIQKTLMVSESGLYALMIYHHIPEIRIFDSGSPTRSFLRYAALQQPLLSKGQPSASCNGLGAR